MTKKRVAILASGSGTNAEKIFEHFQNHPSVEVVLLISNRKKAFVHQRAQRFGIPSITFNRVDFYESDLILKGLQAEKIDLIVLAGFLWLIPENLIAAFPNKIINIHPALLPKYGGKGMYGMHVHEAVKNAGEKESGITIHYVNAAYDEGAIIAQYSCPIESNDSPEDIAKKVQKLEHTFYPKVIEDEVLKSSKNS